MTSSFVHSYKVSLKRWPATFFLKKLINQETHQPLTGAPVCQVLVIAKCEPMFDNGSEVINMTVAQDVRILNERIDAAFRRRYNTRYVLMASKVQADDAISFFL